MIFSGFEQTVFSFLTAHNSFFSQPQYNQTDP
jgi:hypothetical protein